MSKRQSPIVEGRVQLGVTEDEIEELIVSCEFARERDAEMTEDERAFNHKLAKRLIEKAKAFKVADQD